MNCDAMYRTRAICDSKSYAVQPCIDVCTPARAEVSPGMAVWPEYIVCVCRRASYSNARSGHRSPAHTPPRRQHRRHALPVLTQRNEIGGVCATPPLTARALWSRPLDTRGALKKRTAAHQQRATTATACARLSQCVWTTHLHACDTPQACEPPTMTRDTALLGRTRRRVDR